MTAAARPAPSMAIPTLVALAAALWFMRVALGASIDSSRPLRPVMAADAGGAG